MPSELSLIAEPRLLLLAWAAGLAFAAGLVSLFRSVGPGFTWLTAGSAGAVGFAGMLGQGAWWARAALAVLVAGMFWARRRELAGALITLAGVCYVVEASLVGGWAPAVAAAVALGGVTGEMMLGHWFLVDPRLPRKALRALAATGMAGLALDGLTLVVVGDMAVGGGRVVFWVLLVVSILLMAGVLEALRHPAYSAVMAATGLSYLAVLTTLGAVFLGRALVAGVGPFG